MVEEWSTESDGNGLKTIAIILIVVISIAGVTGLTLSADWTEQVHPVREYTTFYTAIAPKEAKELMDNASNLMIVDIRSCDCDYKEGHLEFATWNTNPRSFYNTAHNLLIYCEDGNDSISYCNYLVNHVYGAIYYLEGGISAWKNAGYRVTKL